MATGTAHHLMFNNVKRSPRRACVFYGGDSVFEIRYTLPTLADLAQVALDWHRPGMSYFIKSVETTECGKQLVTFTALDDALRIA